MLIKGQYICCFLFKPVKLRLYFSLGHCEKYEKKRKTKRENREAELEVDN